MRNLSYDAYFLVLIFWATFGGKMGVSQLNQSQQKVGTLGGASGSLMVNENSKPNQKVGTLGGAFGSLGQTLDFETMFSKLSGVNPPPPPPFLFISCS